MTDYRVRVAPPLFATRAMTALFLLGATTTDHSRPLHRHCATHHSHSRKTEEKGKKESTSPQIPGSGKGWRIWRMDNMDFFIFKYDGKYRFRLNLPGILPLFGEISLKFIDTGRIPAHSRKFPGKLQCLGLEYRRQDYGLWCYCARHDRIAGSSTATCYL